MSIEHPLPEGDSVIYELPPCGACNKVREMIPGQPLPQLRGRTITGSILTVMQNVAGDYIYKMNSGIFVHQRMVTAHIPKRD